MNIRQRVDGLNDRLFDTLYSRSLVYNTCWEDPAVDRQALQMDASDRVLVIASAGCNALDYVLAGAGEVYAVDMNPRQIALLELKLAGIRSLAHEDYFALFGRGRHAGFARLYARELRPQLGAFARAYWDRQGTAFDPARGLYFHGLSGQVARGFHLYLACRPRLREAVRALLDSENVAEQRDIYDQRIAPMLWRREVNWLLSRQLTMSMLGVPQPQRREVESQHTGGVAAFIREAIEYVFRQLPLTLNYFWRLYLVGEYSAECCPEYLKPDNFRALKAGLVDRIRHHTCSVTAFLRQTEHSLTRFVLLDHMDWMSSARPRDLAEEWDMIFARASARARVIFRSAHRWPSYLDAVRVDGGSTPLTERLVLHRDLAAALHPQDRVHTYAGFHIADLAT